MELSAVVAANATGSDGKYEGLRKNGGELLRLPAAGI